MTPLSVVIRAVLVDLVTRDRGGEIDAPLFVGGTDAHERIARIIGRESRAARATDRSGFERSAAIGADELVDLHEESLGSGLGAREAR